MRINSDDICKNCKHFNHECGVYFDDEGNDSCGEWCDNPIEEISDRFYDFGDIFKCDGFE